MAFLGQQYAPVTEPPKDEYAPIPAGEYLAMVIDSDVKETKKGDGLYMALTYQVLDGPFKGKTLWKNINLRNPSPVAEGIGEKERQKLQFACGGIAIDDSSQVHNIPHVVKVEFIPAGTKRKNGEVTDRDQNEIRDWKRAEGVSASGFPSGPALGAPASAATADVPSWAATQKQQAAA